MAEGHSIEQAGCERIQAHWPTSDSLVELPDLIYPIWPHADLRGHLVLQHCISRMANRSQRMVGQVLPNSSYPAGTSRGGSSTDGLFYHWQTVPPEPPPREFSAVIVRSPNPATALKATWLSLANGVWTGGIPTNTKSA